MSKEAMKLALEALEHMLEDAKQERLTVEYWNECVDAITALREALAKPDFWEGYVPEPVKPAQQCKWPTCQSEEYQQALAEQIKRELVSEQPAHQEPVWDASAPLVMTPHPAFQQPAQPYKGIADHINQATNGRMRIDPVTGDVGIGTLSSPAQQEPCTRVECMGSNGCIGYCWNKKPAQRTWVGLTHEEHMEIMTGTMTTSSRMAAVEAKLREKNQ